MDANQEFTHIVKKAACIALANLMDGLPNVRIVNHCADAGRPGVIYFSTRRGSEKTTEFEKDEKVAFSTVPMPADGHAHVRSKNATVRKSDFSMDEVKDLFIAQISGFEQTLAVIGRFLDVYEIHVREADVILGPSQTVTVRF